MCTDLYDTALGPFAPESMPDAEDYEFIAGSRLSNRILGNSKDFKGILFKHVTLY